MTKRHNRSHGYTLVELLVVIALIGILAVLAIPAYSKHAKVTQFEQKTDEIKYMINQVYLLSRNPQSTAVAWYRVRAEGDAASGNYGYLLESSTDGTNFVLKDEVKLFANQVIEGIGTDPTNTYIKCPTELSKSCESSVGANVIRFTDFNLAQPKTVDFPVVLDPFNITVNITSVQ